jgi:hypothetical protein
MLHATAAAVLWSVFQSLDSFIFTLINKNV